MQESSLNGNQDAPKTRLALPSKLPSNLIKTDTGKPVSRIPSKGPLKAFPTLGKGNRHWNLLAYSRLRRKSWKKKKQVFPLYIFKHFCWRLQSIECYWLIPSLSIISKCILIRSILYNPLWNFRDWSFHPIH